MAIPKGSNCKMLLDPHDMRILLGPMIIDELIAQAYKDIKEKNYEHDNYRTTQL